MRDIELLLADGREDVKNALEAMETDFPFTLSSRFPRSSAEGDLVTWGEYANLSTECPVVDRLTYQVTVWALDLDRLRALSSGVNRALVGLGLKRVYASPDDFTSDTLGYYTKTFRFGRKVDKRTMRLID